MRLRNIGVLAILSAVLLLSAGSSLDKTPGLSPAAPVRPAGAAFSSLAAVSAATPAATPAAAPATPAPSPFPSPSPALPLSGAKIGIDAGHQGRGCYVPEPTAPGSEETRPRVTTGTFGRASGIPEHELNLRVALALEEQLLALGAEVLMTRRTPDVDISNRERAFMMNEAGVDFCLRIHANGNDDPDIHGALMIIPAESTAPAISAESRALAETILDTYIAATGARDMGLLEAPKFAGFNWSTAPTVIIEMGFMTNEREDLLMADPEYQAKIVQGLTDGILLWHRRMTDNR